MSEGKKSPKTWLKLYATFFSMGLFLFGGGYAMLPLLDRTVVKKHQWSTEEEMLDLYALSQVTPGAIAVNIATFIGNKIGGVFGAVFAVLGVVSPSVIIVSIIAAVLSNFADTPAVIHAMNAVRPMVTALILVTVAKMAKQSWKNWIQILISVVGFVLVAFFGLSPVWVIIIGGVVGFFLLDEKRMNSGFGGKEDK